MQGTGFGQCPDEFSDNGDFGISKLPAAAARPPSAKIAAATKVREVKEEESGTARLVPWVPENTVKSLADLELDKIASGGGLWQSTRW